MFKCVAVPKPHDPLGSTVWSCLPDTTLEVIPIDSIVSMVAMVPHPVRQVELHGLMFVVEKIGLDLGGIQLDDPDIDEATSSNDNDLQYTR